MAIEDRLKPEIRLTPPNGGDDFVAKWIGDPITAENKLGLFDSPKVRGTIVQPLEFKGDRYQFTIFFDGEDHDEESADFFEALKENGAWKVVHPMIGLIDNLYISRYVWENEPVRNVGYTTFNTNWIQGLPESESVSFAGLAANINSFSLDSIQSIIDQFFDLVSLENFEEFNSLVSSVNKATNIIKKTLKKFENLQILNPRIEALFRGIASTIESFPPDVTALAAQFAGLFEAIGLTQNNANGSVDNFSTFSANFDDELSDIENSPADLNSRNAIAVVELNTSLAGVEIARAVLLPGLTTRDQAIEAATKLNDYFTTTTNNLDDIQSGFNNVRIENQYTSQSKSYSDQLKLNKKSIEFLLSAALNLKVERRFPLKTERNPLEIAWTELGGPGEIIQLPDGLRIDKNYNDFCDWNDLHGKSIMWLPAETEVRIFI